MAKGTGAEDLTFNLLQPNITMYILYTVISVFPKVLTEKLLKNQELY